MWPINRGRRKTDEVRNPDSIVYDQISKDTKEANLVMIYDEASLLLFERPRNRTKVKKV